MVLARNDERGFLLLLEFCFTDETSDPQQAISISKKVSGFERTIIWKVFLLPSSRCTLEHISLLELRG